MRLRDAARVPLITSREEVDDGREHFDRIAETRGSVRGPFGALFNSPEVAGRVGELGAYLRYDGAIPAVERELAILTTARQCGCVYEWAVHEPIAREAGVSDAAIEALVEGGPIGDLTEAARVIVPYGRELFDGFDVSEATFAAVEAYYDPREVTELTATMGYYGMVALFCNAFRLIPADHAVPFTAPPG